MKNGNPMSEYDHKVLEKEYDLTRIVKNDFDLSDEYLRRAGLDEFDHVLEDGQQDQAVEASDELPAESVSPDRAFSGSGEKVILHVWSALGSAAIMVLCLLGLYGLLYQVHPNISSGESAQKEQYDVVTKLADYLVNQRSLALNEYLSGENLIRKIYRIPDGTTKAPEPNPACFGAAAYSDAAQVMEVIQQAKDSGLMEGQESIFETDVDFYGRGEIKYYLDETLLVICWKEFIDGKLVNFMEVKMADASQFRRKLAGDAYGAGVQMFATELAAQTDAVAACSADYYAFRPVGILCYEGTLYRYNDRPYGKAKAGNCLDTLFVDKNGDFLFFERGTDMTKDELQSYLDENQISFSLSFGPILVRDGIAQKNSYYPVGQVAQYYSRAGIGQVDRLHYLFVIVSNTGKDKPKANVDQFADIMVRKGIRQGYNLDGGQTGEYIFNNELESLVDFGCERVVSDIIYFATALPKEDWK